MRLPGPSATRYLEPVADVAHVGQEGPEPGARRRRPTAVRAADTTAVHAEIKRRRWAAVRRAVCAMGDAWRSRRPQPPMGGRDVTGQTVPRRRGTADVLGETRSSGRCLTGMSAVLDRRARPARRLHVADAKPQVSDLSPGRAPDNDDRGAGGCGRPSWHRFGRNRPRAPLNERAPNCRIWARNRV